MTVASCIPGGFDPTPRTGELPSCECEAGPEPLVDGTTYCQANGQCLLRPGGACDEVGSSERQCLYRELVCGDTHTPGVVGPNALVELATWEAVTVTERCVALWCGVVCTCVLCGVCCVSVFVCVAVCMSNNGQCTKNLTSSRVFRLPCLNEQPSHPFASLFFAAGKLPTPGLRAGLPRLPPTGSAC